MEIHLRIRVSYDIYTLRINDQDCEHSSYELSWFSLACYGIDSLAAYFSRLKYSINFMLELYILYSVACILCLFLTSCFLSPSKV